MQKDNVKKKKTCAAGIQPDLKPYHPSKEKCWLYCEHSDAQEKQALCFFIQIIDAAVVM